jgi:putative DNA primase/helicase
MNNDTATADAARAAVITELVTEAQTHDGPAGRVYVEKNTAQLEANGWTIAEIDQMRAEAAAMIRRGNESMNGRAGSAMAATAFPFTDAGNAKRFVRLHGRDFRYVFEQRRWLHWDGRVWATDTIGHVQRAGVHTAAAMYGEAAALDDDSARQALVKHARASEGKARLDAMVSVASADAALAIAPDVLDADPWALNVANGTVNLRTGELREHDPAEMHSKIAGAALAEASAPRWETFLEQVLPDREVRAFVQKLAGYSLTGEVGEHVLPFVHGSGANGKSVFLAVLRKVLGDYAAEAAPELLVARYGDRGVPTDILDLRGFRFVTTTEVEGNKRMDATLMKRITGEDTLKARAMRQDFVEFRNVTHLWMAANDKPPVDGLDEAVWRRLRLIPFGVTIDENKRDPELIAKLMAERDAILGWLVAGCVAYVRDGLKPPAAVLAATDEYRAESNPLLEWWEARGALEKHAETPSRELHDSYREWCAESRFRGKPIAINSPKWSAGLASLGLQGLQMADSARTRAWRGGYLLGRSGMAI